MSNVRTRFAPSPTGFLHVGSVRTAIFAWLLARHFGGTFILRVEDTDQERLVEGAIRSIIEDLRWLGIEIDEGPSETELKATGGYWDEAPVLKGDSGPYIQSQRLSLYQDAAEELVRKGFAYRCDCSPERLQKEREEQAARKEPPGYSGYCRNRNVDPSSKHVIRLRIPDNETIVLNDAVKGPISWQSLSLKDTVLLKSDGFPTYHLAVVVDDHHMRISHVLRGDEWIPSTPIHLLLYKAFGWDPPVFAHLPVVLGNDGKKLSKRHGATNLNSFRESGYLPQALFNFLVLIGWSPGDGEEKEIFPLSEIIERFSIEHINKAPGIFSYEKLNWMNGVYIRNLSDSELEHALTPILLEAGLKVDTPKLQAIIPHIKERLALLKDAPGLVDFLFVDKVEPDIKAMFHKGIDREKAEAIITRAISALEAVTSFEHGGIEQALRALASQMELSPSAVFTVIRIAVTGKKVTPPLFESIHVLGPETTISRLRSAADLVHNWKAN